MIKFILKAAIPVMMVAIGAVSIASVARANAYPNPILRSVAFHCLSNFICTGTTLSSCRGNDEWPHPSFPAQFTIVIGKLQKNTSYSFWGADYVKSIQNSECWYKVGPDNRWIKIMASSSNVVPYGGYHPNGWDGRSPNNCQAHPVFMAKQCPFREKY